MVQACNTHTSFTNIIITTITESDWNCRVLILKWEWTAWKSMLRISWLQISACSDWMDHRPYIYLKCLGDQQINCCYFFDKIRSSSRQVMFCFKAKTLCAGFNDQLCDYAFNRQFRTCFPLDLNNVVNQKWSPDFPHDGLNTNILS